MNEYEDFYLEQEVKFFMNTDYEELIEQIEAGGFFEIESFDFKHLEKLKKMLLNNNENKLVYLEMQEHLYDMLDFLEDYVTMDIDDFDRYQQSLSEIRAILDTIRTVEFNDYIKKEFESRFQYPLEMFLTSEQYKYLIQDIFDSVSMDLENINYLNPKYYGKIDLTDPINDHYLILSLSYFYKEHPNLFIPKEVDRRIRLILMRLSNQTYKGCDEKVVSTLKDSSRRLLKKIIG